MAIRPQLLPRYLRAAILISMLFLDHAQEVVSVQPPRWLMKILGFLNKVLGNQLPR